MFSCHFFFNAPATTEIYTLSLHDALPISKSFNTRAVMPTLVAHNVAPRNKWTCHDSSGNNQRPVTQPSPIRSEEHTSELQSRRDLVCRLLLEKKKKKTRRQKKNTN